MRSPENIVNLIYQWLFKQEKNRNFEWRLGEIIHL